MNFIAAALDRATLVDSPFHHLVVKDVLPADIAATILREMPPVEVLAQGKPIGSNQRFPLPTPQALADPGISAAWKQAMAAVNESPQELLDRVITHLGERILAVYPDFEARFGPLDELKAVPRYQPDRRRDEVGFDAQIVVNSPALAEGSRVRGPHLDVPDKLVSALLYLRDAEDDSTGAELQLYEPLSDELVFDAHNNLPLDVVRLVRTYPYRHNLMIFPINTPLSLHGVSPRSRTTHPRYHIHIVGEMAEPLFAMTKASGQYDTGATALAAG